MFDHATRRHGCEEVDVVDEAPVNMTVGMFLEVHGQVELSLGVRVAELRRQGDASPRNQQTEQPAAASPTPPESRGWPRLAQRLQVTHQSLEGHLVSDCVEQLAADAPEQVSEGRVAAHISADDERCEAISNHRTQLRTLPQVGDGPEDDILLAE